jgi:hypothetical protein
MTSCSFCGCWRTNVGLADHGATLRSALGVRSCQDRIPHPITVVGMRLLVIEFNADKYRMSRAMAEAHRRTAVLPMLQIQEAVERVARGPVQEMVSSMAEAHRRTAVLPTLQIQEAVEAAAGAQIQEIVRTLLVHRFEVRPLLDTQRMAEIAQGILESNIAGPGEPTTDGGPASAAVALPGNAPLFPGLASPLQQVRNWKLEVWVGFFLTVVTILLAVAALRAPRGLTPQEVEQIIRSVQESARISSTTPTPTTVPPSTTMTSSTTPAPTKVTVVSSPSQRAAGGRPQGRP